MEVRVLQSWDDLAPLQASWEKAHALDDDAGYFLSWPWMVEVFRANPDRWCILAAKPGGKSTDHVCFLPLKTRTRWSESNQRFKTELGPGGKLSWAQYTGFVCVPEFEKSAIGAIAHAVLGMPWSRWSLQHDGCERRLNMLLDRIPEKHYRIRHRPQLINKGEVDNLICPQIALPADYETYLQTCLSSNTRQKLRRFWRQFETSEELTITDSSEASFADDLNCLLDMWQKSWAPIRGQSSAERAAAKYREVLGQSNNLGTVHICTLRRGDIRLGALCSIVDRHKKHSYFIAAGRDETVRDINVGMLLHAHNIQWAIANGIKTYDFCHGNEAYKYSYGATDRPVSNVEITRRSSCEISQLDPARVGDAMRRTIRMLEDGQTEAAANACRQILPLIA